MVESESWNDRLVPVFKTNLFDMQRVNGVLSQMKATKEKIFTLQDYQSRKLIELKWIIRRRYSWPMSCESHPYTSSESYFETLRELRPYFYGPNDLRGFPDALTGHGHADISTHDDGHGGTFHLHLKGVFPDTARIFIIVCQGILLLCFTILLMVLICTSRAPT